MKQIIFLLLLGAFTFAAQAEEKQVVSQYTDLQGITYIKYAGEDAWVTTVPNQANANPLLTKNVQPGKNLFIDEGTIAIEVYDHSGMFAKGGMTEEDTKMLSVDPELNSFNIIPNPPQDNLNLSFELAEETDVEILIYEYSGKLIRPLITQRFNAGTQQISIPAKEFSEQQYYVTFKIGDRKITKMVYMR